MKTYVIDTSVLARSALSDQSQSRVRLPELFNQPNVEIVSIPLIRIEFANALRFNQTGLASMTESLEKMYRLPIRIFDLKSNHVLASLQLAFNTQTTVYDAAYHQTAIILNGTMITCDEKYYSKTKHLGHIELWT